MSFAAIEAALVARLTDRVKTPGLVRAVLSAADLAGMKEQGQITPALHVILSRFRVTDGTTDAAQVTSTWWIVVAVRNAIAGRETGASTARAREDAGALMDAVIPALIGYRPPNTGASALRMVDPPPPDIGDGFAYYPLAFTTETVFQGENK